MPDSPTQPPTSNTGGPKPINYAAPGQSLFGKIQDKLPATEQIIHFLKTLAWVVPLTLLIWIYAVREQIVTSLPKSFPIEVRTTAPDRVVVLRGPADKNVIAELSGPSAKIDKVLEMLRPRADGAAIQIFIDPQLGVGAQELLGVNQLNNHPIFKNAGVTVKSCQPPYLKIDIDKLEEEEVPVRVTPELEAKLSEPPIFAPSTVKLRAPSLLLNDARQKNALFVYADIGRNDQLKNKSGRIELDAVPVNWIHRENVTIGPVAIKATLNLKQPDVNFTISTVTVFKETTAGMEDKFKIEYPGVMTNVTITGPAEQIELIRKGTFRVRARLEISPLERPNQDIEKELIFDLPQGVTLTRETLERTKWKYRLIER